MPGSIFNLTCFADLRLAHKGAFVSAVLLVGCSEKGLELAPVNGSVTFNGRAVGEGTVTFYPEVGRPASGELDATGRYCLTTISAGDGAEVGRNRVVILAMKVHGAQPPPKSFSEEVRQTAQSHNLQEPPRTEWLVPEKYSSETTTPLIVIVEPGGNEINFDLP